ncbi:MFS transporter [Spelaeicoccus albus]|uniref:Putative MFS transporter n=1 Tax=Spelaeicoccus albus TaxID=1280376 RepID=A0A7Z0D053_9MICO|nr:MFS transporter [Spelaeicoccus albus]NYI66939.1 putative MFS transporter [Spelaeicoccus albus]
MSDTNKNSDDTRLVYDQLTTAVDGIRFQRNHVLILLLVGFGMLFDAIEQYNVGYAGPFLMDNWDISTAQVGLLTTATFGGLAVGSIIAGISSDLYGRRITYMYNLLLFTVGGLVSAFAPNYDFLLVARVAVGLGLGGEMSAALTLVSEVTPTRARGTALGWVNISAGGIGIFVAGGLATLILGPLSPFLGGDSTAWRYLLGILIIPALFVFYFRRYLPETPRFLVSTGQIGRANRVLSQLATGKLHPVKNLNITRYISGEEGKTLTREKVRISEMFKGGLLRRTVVLWILEITTFPAQVAVTSLMPSILVSRGISKDFSLTFASLINVGSLAGAILAATFAFYFPRRLVFVGCAIVAIITSVGFGFSASSIAMIVFGMLASLAYMILNTSVWLYNPEIYPTRLRGIGTGVGTAIGLAAASIFPAFAGRLIDKDLSSTLFVIIAVMYAVFAIAAIFGPETHKKSLEQIASDA